MIRVTTKSGKQIDLSEIELASVIAESMETLIDTHIHECSCQFNESNNHCECDGGVEEDDYEIGQVSVVYIEDEERI